MNSNVIITQWRFILAILLFLFHARFLQAEAHYYLCKSTPDASTDQLDPILQKHELPKLTKWHNFHKHIVLQKYDIDQNWQFQLDATKAQIIKAENSFNDVKAIELRLGLIYQLINNPQIPSKFLEDIDAYVLKTAQLALATGDQASFQALLTRLYELRPTYQFDQHHYSPRILHNWQHITSSAQNSLAHINISCNFNHGNFFIDGTSMDIPTTKTFTVTPGRHRISWQTNTQSHYSILLTISSQETISLWLPQDGIQSLKTDSTFPSCSHHEAWAYCQSTRSDDHVFILNERSQLFQLQPISSATAQYSLLKSSYWKKNLAYGLAGAGILSALVASVFAINSHHLYHQDFTGITSDSWAQHLQKIDTSNKAADSLLIVSTSLLSTGLIFYLLDYFEEKHI